MNIVVILTERVRQAEDPRAAELLHRLRLRTPTQDDIDLLNSRVGAHLRDPNITPIIVRRHKLRHRLNMKRLQFSLRETGTAIMYCVANIKSHSGISLSQIYRLRFGQKNIKGDAILPLIPGAPLMLTKNINRPLGKSFPRLIEFWN